MPECSEFDGELCRFRGDTTADRFRLTTAAGAPIDISSGFTFRLTINTEKDPNVAVSPEVGTELVQITATIDGGSPEGSDGRFRFPFTPVQADQVPATYFYDIEMVSPSGVETIAKGKYVFRQDVTKVN